MKMADTNFYWGRIIREIRRAQDISIKQLGRLSGVGENTVGNIERRSQNCSVGVLDKILLALGYELEAMAIDPKPIRFIRSKRLRENETKTSKQTIVDYTVGSR